MNPLRWHKSPHLLVSPLRTAPGLRVLHRPTGRVLTLDAGQTQAWERWAPLTLAHHWPATTRRLRSLEMILPAAGPDGEPLPAHPLDGLRPRTSPRFVKWHDESADCVVLFHTGALRRSNPLLVLGPRGSLCWRLVGQGRTVREIRREVRRVFGLDGIVPFLGRLAGMGFLAPLPPAAGVVAADRADPVEEFPAPEVQAELARTAIPWYCLWEICTICDLRCRGCYLTDFTRPGPSPRLALTRARQLAEAGVFYVTLLGGEALLRDDLEAIVSELRSHRVFVKLITNGLRLTAARARSLAAAGLNQVEVSFDGLTRASHEASRGAGTFAAARRALVAAGDAGIPRRAVVWTVHSRNWAEAVGLPRFLADLDLAECYLSRFQRPGPGGDGAPWRPLEPADRARLRRMVADLKRSHPGLSITLPEGCSCGRSSLIVGPGGGVRTCPFVRTEVGNLDRQSLDEIWSSLDATHRGEGPFGICAGARAAARA